MSVPCSIPQENEWIRLSRELENRYIRLFAGGAMQDLRRHFSWKDDDGIVHITEVMATLWSGFNRVTLCRRFLFNQKEQSRPHTVLDIVPCGDVVSCLLCLGIA